MMVLATMAAEATARATVRAVQTARSVTTAEGLYLPAMADLARLICGGHQPVHRLLSFFHGRPPLRPPHVQGVALCVAIVS